MLPFKSLQMYLFAWNFYQLAPCLLKPIFLSSKTMHSLDNKRIVRRELKENDHCILQFYSAQKTKHLLENKSIVILLSQQCVKMHINASFFEYCKIAQDNCHFLLTRAVLSFSCLMNALFLKTVKMLILRGKCCPNKCL
jgi:hypothetical protein